MTTFLITVFGSYTPALGAYAILAAVQAAAAMLRATRRHRLPPDRIASPLGLCAYRHAATLLLLIVAHQLDVILGMAQVRELSLLVLIASAAIEIIQSAAALGAGVPAPLLEGLRALQRRVRGGGGATGHDDEKNASGDA